MKSVKLHSHTWIKFNRKERRKVFRRKYPEYGCEVRSLKKARFG